MSSRRAGIHQKMKNQKQEGRERRLTPVRYNQDRVLQIPVDAYERPVYNQGPRQYNDYYEEEAYYDHHIEVPPRKMINHRGQQLIIPGKDLRRQQPPYIDQRSKQIIKQDRYYDYDVRMEAPLRQGRQVQNQKPALKTLRIKKPKQSAVVSKTQVYKQRGLLPIINPTGNPYKNIKIPSDKEMLKKLQVKVDLQKIGDAPRAFGQRLVEAQSHRGGHMNRLTLSQRFQKIQDAPRAIDPQTIILLNEKLGLKGAEAKTGVKIETNLPKGEENTLKMPKKKKQEIREKIQARKNKMVVQKVQKKYVRK